MLAYVIASNLNKLRHLSLIRQKCFWLIKASFVNFTYILAMKSAW